MKDNDKNEKLSLFKYCYGNNLYGWAMLQKLPNKWIWLIWDLAEFNEDFTKSYNDKSYEKYLLELHVKYSENLHDLQNDLPFYLKEWKFEKKNCEMNLVYMR